MNRAVKDLVHGRANGSCECCRCPERFATQPHSVEHILPRTKGGPDDENNLALSYQGCNDAKFIKTHAVDELTNQTVPLFHPRTMQWDEHFAWSADYSEIIPISAVGRATVRELHLNRPGVRNLRRVLYLTGEHPNGPK